MGDGLAKLLSPRAHNRFYQFPAAPQAYKRLLERQNNHPFIPIAIGVGMLLLGAGLSTWVERRA